MAPQENGSAGVGGDAVTNYDYHVETLTACSGCGRGMRGNEIAVIRPQEGTAFCYDCVQSGKPREWGKDKDVLTSFSE